MAYITPTFDDRLLTQYVFWIDRNAYKRKPAMHRALSVHAFKIGCALFGTDALDFIVIRYV